MSNARLRTRIKRLVRERLSGMGFELSRPRIPERRCDCLRQGIEFYPGTSSHSGEYTLNVYWTFSYDGEDSPSRDGSWRIGELLGQNDTWFSRRADDLDEEFDRVAKIILDVAIPHLDRFRSIADILSALESRALSAGRAFGASIGWQEFHKGFCYSRLGRYDEAIKHLTTLVNEYSVEDYDFVQTRKQRAVNELDSIYEKLRTTP